MLRRNLFSAAFSQLSWIDNKKNTYANPTYTIYNRHASCRFSTPVLSALHAVQRRYQMYGLDTPFDPNSLTTPKVAEAAKGFDVVYRSDTIRTAAMLYAIVTIAWDPESDEVVMYHAATNSVLPCRYDDPHSVKAMEKWLLECRIAVAEDANVHQKKTATNKGIHHTAEEVHTIVYTAHPVTAGSGMDKSKLLAKLRTDPQVIMDRSAWEVVRSMFGKQQEVVKAAGLPTSLEHAYLDLTHKKYDCLSKAALTTSTTTTPTVSPSSSPKGKKGKAKDHAAPKGDPDLLSAIEKPTPLRLAVLAWDTMVKTFERFGTEGGKKSFTPQEHIIRNAIKIVNVFIVSCDNKVQSGTVRNGITYASEVFNCQTRRSTTTQFRSLQDQSKRAALTTLLFGEGNNTVTLLIPSPGTKIHQVQFFARMCKPKCPYLIADAHSLSRHLAPESASPLVITPDVIKGRSSDPKKFWNELLKTLPTGTDDERHQELLKAASAFALTVSSQRRDVNAISLAAATGRGIIVPPQAETDAFAEVSNFTGSPVQQGTPAEVTGGVFPLQPDPKVPHAAKKADPVSAAVAAATSSAPVKQFVDTASQVFLNKVNLMDMAPAQALDEWRKRIYFNDDRLKRETAAAESLRRYLVIDLETTTVKRYKRIANPFTGENWIVLSGARDYKGNVFMNTEYFDKEVSQKYDDSDVLKKHAGGVAVKGSSPNSLFLPPLDDYDVIVGHNLKFDLMHLWRDKELRKFFERGGMIWDTMYAEYLLTGQQVRLGRGAGLEDVAKSYGGRTPKLDEVKEAWASGKNTYEIPPATLIEYLHGDLNNTELIFKKHIARALEQRQVIIVQARMDGLLCTTEMEYNGLRVDLDVAIQQATELNEKAAALELETKKHIPKEIPPRLRKHWNWASNQHLGLYFFGNPLEITTNSFLSNKNLPRCSWGRHNIADQNLGEVNLGPPNLIAAPAECAILAGGYASDKSTKVAKSYLLHYFTEGGFRKSAPWLESLAAPIRSVPLVEEGTKQLPKYDDSNSTVQPLINMLPSRYLILTVAVEEDAVSQLPVSIVFYNTITKESKTFSKQSEPETMGAKIEEYLLEQCRAHTRSLIDDNNVHIHMFKPAQVLLLTRDAPITFASYCERDPALSKFMDKYSCNREYYEYTSDFPIMTVSPVDCNSALEWYRQYTTAPALVPAELALGRGKSSGSPFRDDMRLPAKEWCEKYGELMLTAAHNVFAKEDIVAKKLTKKQREARHKDESTMPLLMRTVATLRHTIANEMSPDEIKRYELLFFLGKMAGTNFDPFYVVGYPKTVEIPIPGVLQKYVPEKGAAISIMEKFRSLQTSALQVGTETLSYFAKTHNDPAAKAITNLRAMQKLIGTYYEFSEGSTGMVSLVHESDQCIHHELVHVKTNTGRLASANPNCQNIPKEDKSPLREMFISRFHNGVCIEADYSQLEVITLAALANDREMIKDLHNKVDFHCKRVTMMRPDLEYDDVVLRAKKNKEPEFVKMRQQAKIFSFQRQYGAGVRMLSESTGLSHDQIKCLIEKERAIYKDCDIFASMVTLSANAYDPTIQDGARNADGQLLHKGMFPVITGTRYIFSESDLPAVIQGNLNEWEKKTNFSPTHLKNYPVQGFAGEIVQIMLGRLWRHFVKNKNYGGKALLTNTVHDCVWVDTVPEVTAQVAKDVDHIMSNAKHALNELWPEMSCVVEFPVDVVAGENMCHLRPLKELPDIFKAQKEREEETKKEKK